ncbi:hypothetical protein P7L78_13865 [Tistrella bauzanensis]|jgi:hypothetical protein|uniref:Uncharacterized protein n=1 Tax=Tistrella arctica TaxID=3133430 RepID=A0ABU9YHL5_9PROT
MALDPPMIGLAPMATISGLVVRDNQLPPFMTVHDLLMAAG